VQVDPIKPTLKAPGAKRLKLKHDEPLSNIAFSFNLRRYNAVSSMRAAYRKPFVAFGMRSLKATGLPADDYLQVPQMARSCRAT